MQLQDRSIARHTCRGKNNCKAMAETLTHKQPRALVTGGTGGIGTVICRKLSQLGYHVIANFHPAEQATINSWQKQQLADGFSIETLPADVSDYADCQQMADQIHQSGGLYLLVNNAGIVRDATLKKLEPHHWQSVIDTNLGSLYNVSRQFVDAMMQAEAGRIINISSVNGQKGQFGQTNYSAAKAGVHGFTMALAQETASKGITVNTISPGFIDTEMVKSIPEQQREAIIASIPVRRIGQPEDIAHAVAFLADPASGYVTGINLAVNGGVFMH